MFSTTAFTDSLFTSNAHFDDLALNLFNFQYKNNTLYRDYLKALNIAPQTIQLASDIPSLPIGFFKTHEVKTGHFTPQLVFESSGTTQNTPSRCLLKSPTLYEQSFRNAFTLFYGDIREYTVLGLLPSYLERENSSLVYMVNDFIQSSSKPASGFYLNEYEKLYNTLRALEKAEEKVLLIGVTFGLLDFAEKHAMQLRHTTVMETGGMKGRRTEQTREEVHDFLKRRLGIRAVHSEYGMTELLSQAYSKENGLFRSPPWMKISLREIDDPLSVIPPPSSGASSRGLINVTDLANVDTCGFIATDDVGVLYADGSFEVLGRRDQSDLRGCSLMAV